jgi:plasmid stabilization system protein ParE
MNYRVVFSPEAQEQIAELYRYIAKARSPVIAARYTEAIVSYCENLRTFPLRGVRRDDMRPGLRITHYK